MNILNIIKRLEEIDVLCYSEKQGCLHRENLSENILINVFYPQNEYYIVKFLEPVPEDIYKEIIESNLSKYIRFKKINEIDTSKYSGNLIKVIQEA